MFFLSPGKLCQSTEGFHDSAKNKDKGIGKGKAGVAVHGTPSHSYGVWRRKEGKG